MIAVVECVDGMHRMPCVLMVALEVVVRVNEGLE